MDLVRDNLIWGSLFTFVTLLVFLRSGRSTIIIFAHILISTIGAFLVMPLMGRSLNVPASAAWRSPSACWSITPS